MSSIRFMTTQHVRIQKQMIEKIIKDMLCAIRDLLTGTLKVNIENTDEIPVGIEVNLNQVGCTTDVEGNRTGKVFARKQTDEESGTETVVLLWIAENGTDFVPYDQATHGDWTFDCEESQVQLFQQTICQNGEIVIVLFDKDKNIVSRITNADLGATDDCLCPPDDTEGGTTIELTECTDVDYIVADQSNGNYFLQSAQCIQYGDVLATALAGTGTVTITYSGGTTSGMPADITLKIDPTTVSNLVHTQGQAGISFSFVDTDTVPVIGNGQYTTATINY